MQYAHILALIDDRIKRLTEARDILLSVDTASPRTMNRPTAVPVEIKRAKAPVKKKWASQARKVTLPERTEESAFPRKQRGAKRPDAARHVVPPQVLEPALAQHEAVQLKQDQSVPENVLDAVPTEKVLATPRRTESKTAPLKIVSRMNVTTISKHGALGGMVSSSPVFVPASKILQEQAQKVRDSEANLDSAQSSPASPLTAELLAERWMRG